MGKTNTEKPTGKAEQKKQVVKAPKQKKEDLAKAPVQKNEETVEETKMEENKTETKKEKIGWMILAEKSLNKMWNNKKDEGVWAKYL